MRYDGKIGLHMTAAALSVALLLSAAGCRHQPVRQPLPVSHTPVALESAPEPQTPPMLEAPEEPQEEIPIAAAAASPKKERKRSAKPAAGMGSTGVTAQAPGEPESGTDTSGDASLIGDLTAGGASNSQNTQEAQALLKDNDGRLRALPEPVQRSQRSQLNKVRNFDRQAHKALGSGDAEGAKTLATKAKLLLDDLEK